MNNLISWLKKEYRDNYHTVFFFYRDRQRTGQRFTGSGYGQYAKLIRFLFCLQLRAILVMFFSMASPTSLL